ncbi:hypothetical protein HWV23_03425 [Natronomonas halophila]|uniref:hypothetical protein n=1 Tax=Natronomonas halophila TaxID=2747817 RepID=UPI0015B509AC|nr:hypothetical protein [Natronomonas halophila]QLD84802.1 hypothetical protein HWV23_03425 [Natronomonas halophila]
MNPQTQHQQPSRFGSITWLQEELAAEVRFVDDPDLTKRIYQWLRDAHDLPGGDMVSIVDHHLTQLRRIDSDDEDAGMAEYPMRRVDGDGTGDFPDSCKGCEHYRTRCPVFIDPVERRRREALESEYADADMSQTKRAYRRYAESIGCHQITQALADRAEEYNALWERGMDLYEESDVEIGHTDESDEAARIEAQVAQGDR